LVVILKLSDDDAAAEISTFGNASNEIKLSVVVTLLKDVDVLGFDFEFVFDGVFVTNAIVIDKDFVTGVESHDFAEDGNIAVWVVSTGVIELAEDGVAKDNGRAELARIGGAGVLDEVVGEVFTTDVDDGIFDVERRDADGIVGDLGVFRIEIV